jgi:hypothetical protein
MMVPVTLHIIVQSHAQFTTAGPLNITEKQLPFHTDMFLKKFVYLTTLVTTKVINIGRSQFNVHTGKRTQVCGTQSFLAVTHPSTNRGRRCLTSVNPLMHDFLKINLKEDNVPYMETMLK